MYGPQTRKKSMLECSSQGVMLIARFPNPWPCDCAVYCSTNYAINEPFGSWATASLCCRTIHRDTTRTHNCLNPGCFENGDGGPVCSAIARSWIRVPGKLGFLFFFNHLMQIVHLRGSRSWKWENFVLFQVERDSNFTCPNTFIISTSYRYIINLQTALRESED